MGYQNDGILFELNIARTNIPLFLEKIGFLGSHYTERVNRLNQKEYYAENFEDEVKRITSKDIEPIKSQFKLF